MWPYRVHGTQAIVLFYDDVNNGKVVLRKMNGMINYRLHYHDFEGLGLHYNIKISNRDNIKLGNVHGVMNGNCGNIKKCTWRTPYLFLSLIIHLFHCSHVFDNLFMLKNTSKESVQQS